MPPKKRPVFLNLTQISLPLSGLISILHRLSGVLLFLAIPLFLWTLQESLEGQAEFEQVFNFSPLVKILLLILAWAFAHHFFAGIRYLLLDIDRGGERDSAKKTSVAVLALSLILTLLVGFKLW